MDTKKISILGCGWLGLPLAKRLVKKGYAVLGTTTQQSKLTTLEKEGITALQVDLQKEEGVHPLLFQSEILVLAFPPKTKSTSGDWYFQAIKRIAEASKFSPVKRIVLLSSISVYPNVAQVMTEDHPLAINEQGSSILVEAEKVVLNSNPDSIVLRLGGLAGDDRWLARHFSGKKDLPNGDSPVNLLHKEDALHVLEMCIEKEVPHGVYNVCSPEHPTKKELYSKECREAGWPLPEYMMEHQQGGKTISVDKWVKTAQYQFLFDSPFDYTYSKKGLK